MSYLCRKALAVGGALAAAALVVPSPASASPSAAFNATFQNTSSVVTASRQADGNTFISAVLQVVYARDLVGAVVEHADVVIHPNGSLNFSGADVCTYTLTGTDLSARLPCRSRPPVMRLVS